MRDGFCLPRCRRSTGLVLSEFCGITSSGVIYRTDRRRDREYGGRMTAFFVTSVFRDCCSTSKEAADIKIKQGGENRAIHEEEPVLLK